MSQSSVHRQRYSGSKTRPETTDKDYRGAKSRDRVSPRRADLPDHIGDYDRDLLAFLCEDNDWTIGDLAYEVHEERQDIRRRLEHFGVEPSSTKAPCEAFARHLWLHDPEDFRYWGGDDE